MPSARRLTLAFLCFFAAASPAAFAKDPLPSWNDTHPKQALLAFIEKVTREGGPDFVPPAERIATFDNDGTLWCEQPMYFQEIFAFDRIKAMADAHPEWKDRAPYKWVIAGDLERVADHGEKSLLEIIATTHSGMTVPKFHSIVEEWMHTARHPRFHQPYDKCIYQPMVELLQYLRANGFKTFIVSGGGIEFMRPWTVKAYGIPPEQVVGSSGVVKFEMRDGRPALLKEPKVEFIDDGPGKPVGINHFIGRRPILAFGNSDGDFEMLEYTTIDGAAATKLPRIGLIVHHTDAQREYAYDRNSKVGRLNKALDAAKPNGWIVVDMKNDWRKVFAFEN